VKNDVEMKCREFPLRKVTYFPLGERSFFFIIFLHSAIALLLHLLPLELLGGFLLLGLGLVIISAFDNDVVLLGKDELDVAGRGHVGVNTTVSTVSTAPHLSRAIHLNVSDDEVVDIESLVVGVGFRVLQEGQEKFGGLLGPASLGAGCVPSFGLGVTTGTSDVTSEWHDLLEFDNVLEETRGALEGHVTDGSGGLTRVLIMHAQVGTARLD